MYVCLVIRDLSTHHTLIHPSFLAFNILSFFLLFFFFLVFLFSSCFLSDIFVLFSSHLFIFCFVFFPSVFVFPPPVFWFISPPSFMPHALITSHYHNQAPGASFGSPSPSERAQWRCVSPHPLAPSANRLPLLHPVCRRSAAAGQSGKSSGCWLGSDWTKGNREGGEWPHFVFSFVVLFSFSFLYIIYYLLLSSPPLSYFSPVLPSPQTTSIDISLIITIIL